MEHANDITRVVVGVDGSPHSHRALRWAAVEASRRGARLDVVLAWSMPHARDRDGTERIRCEADARQMLDDTVATLADLGCDRPEITTELVEADPATLLVGFAVGAEMLVVGSRGHGGFAGLLLGSVSERCMDHAPCPVVVVPHGWIPNGARRVVVGIDGSAMSSQALAWAIDAAVRRDATLEVVNAFHYHHVISPFGPVVSGDRDTISRASSTLLEREIADAVRRNGRKPRDVAEIAYEGHAAKALLSVADGAELLVVGSLGNGHFSGLHLGSVSRQCVHHAPCPTVVVRPSLAADPTATPAGRALAEPLFR